MTEPRPVYQALIDAALIATGADRGWLLQARDERLVVLAAGGGDDPRALHGVEVGIDGARGYAVSSGQPAALRPQGSDSSNQGAGGAADVPRSILAAPCGSEDVVGVMELVDKPDDAGFTFDDVEIVSLLADVAGAAISSDDGADVEVAPPERLGVELASLAARDSRRYADVARVIEAMLGQSA